MMTTTAADLRQRRDGRRVVAAALGACVGLSGIDHGIFEVLQGNTATPGFFIDAIGPVQRMWEYGTESAFTLVPNFLATGVLAITAGVATTVWSAGFLDRRRGATVLLVLGLLTFAVGGGIGMLPFLVFGWAVARRIGRPVRHQRRLPAWLSAGVSGARTRLVGSGLVLYLAAIWIAVTGEVPGMSDADQILTVCWSLLGGALALFAVSLVGAAPRPLEEPVRTSDRGEIETVVTQ